MMQDKALDMAARHRCRQALRAIKAGRAAEQMTSEEALGAFHATSDGLVGYDADGKRWFLTEAGAAWLRENGGA